MFYDTKYNRWQGVVAMAVGLVVSVGLFSDNGVIYNGPIANAYPGIGDVTFIVGFLLTGILYYLFNLGLGKKTTEARAAMGSQT